MIPRLDPFKLFAYISSNIAGHLKQLAGLRSLGYGGQMLLQIIGISFIFEGSYAWLEIFYSIPSCFPKWNKLFCSEGTLRQYIPFFTGSGYTDTSGYDIFVNTLSVLSATFCYILWWSSSVLVSLSLSPLLSYNIVIIKLSMQLDYNSTNYLGTKKLYNKQP